EDTAEAIRGWVLVERAQPLGEDAARLFEGDRSNRRHRPQLAEDAQHASRPAQHARSEIVEVREPLAPRRGVWPRGQRVNHRQREVGEMREVGEIALQLPGTCRL